MKKNVTPITVWEQRAHDTDHVLKTALERVVPSHVCVLGVGSYGRREMAPYSDVDVLVLISEDVDTNDTGFVSFIRALQSAHPRTSTVVRSVAECLEIVETDIRSWLSLLEARFILGEHFLGTQLTRNLERQIQDSGECYFLDKIRGYFFARGKKYGDSSRLLEPNIKNSEGALRDLLALYYSALLVSFAKNTPESKESPLSFPDALAIIDLARERKDAVTACWSFLLSVREQMHLTVGYLHDILEYDLQRQIAEKLGYGAVDVKETVEKFMGDYYRHTRSLRSAYEILFAVRGTSEGRIRVLDDVFYASLGSLHILRSEQALTDEETMRAWFHVCNYDLAPGRDVLESVDAFVSSETATFTSSSLALFDELLRMKANVGKTLRRMNDHGVLGTLIPEFGDLNHFFQHNIYHYYTADEHTLIALEHCEALRQEATFLGDLFRETADSTILYYSILFHDIAKPVDVGQHDVLGEGVAREILHRMGRSDISDIVGFAVRNHLLTEKTAFRRNIHDKSTIAPYAKTVGTPERLHLLHILAYADMAALNPNVWTAWKGEILQELHKATLEMFNTFEQNNAMNEPPDILVPPVLIPSGVPDTSPRNTAILQPNEADDVDRYVLDPDKDHSFNVFFHDGASYTVVTIVTRDAPYLLSKLAAVFLSTDTGVVDATVRTKADGTAVDIFRIYDLITGSSVGEGKQQEIVMMLSAVLKKELETEVLFRRHRDKWKRKIRKSTNPVTRIDVAYQQHVSDTGAAMTIIDVYAPDTLGLLYRLTEKISSFRLNILSAKIATRVDGVVDSFYVAEANGEPLTNERTQKELKQALLDQIQQLTAHPVP